MPMDEKNFKFYKQQSLDDKRVHDTQLLHMNNPEAVIHAYQGQFHTGSHGQLTGLDGTLTEGEASGDSMIENYLFIFANTALPSLFFQNPRIIVKSKTKPFEAAVISAYLNNDFGEDDKEENQLCIIDALLPYGMGVMKNGYNSRTGKVKKDRANIFTGQTKTNEDRTNDMEGDVEFISFEKTIGLRHSPKKVWLDSTQPFRKGNRITFEYQRTLQQIIDSNLYQLSSNFMSFFSAKATDKRDIKMTLNEMWIMINGFAHKLAWVDGWREELVFIKTKYKQLPNSLLRFNKMGDVLYNVSHGKLGLDAQKELNYLNELWKKHIDNIRNQVIVDETALTESGKLTLKNNDIGGIVGASRAVTAGVFANLQSGRMDANLFGNITNVREYLKLLLSVAGGKGGGPDAKLATVERNKALGDVLRSAGLQDNIRDFIIDQAKQRIKNILTLASPNVVLTLSEKGLVNPFTGKEMEAGTEIQIGSQKPAISLKELIKGNLDIDFVFDVDITSAQRPDFPVIRQQLIQGAEFAVQIEPKLNLAGKKIEWDLILQDYYATFDAIPDAQKYISNMSEQEKQQAILNMQQQAVAGQGGKKATKAVPTEGSIERSTQVPVPGAV